MDDAELKSMDAQVNQLTESLKKEQQTFKEKQSSNIFFRIICYLFYICFAAIPCLFFLSFPELHSLNSSLTTEQAQTQLDQLKKEVSNEPHPAPELRQISLIY